MNIKFSFFETVLRLNISFLIGVFLLGGLIYSVSFADTPPTGKLNNGAYTHWIENALETPPTVGEALGENNVMKQTQAIANEKGEKVLWIVDGKLGVGIETPQEILDIRSSGKSSLAIESNTSKANFFLNTSAFSLENKKVFLNANGKKIFITEDGIEVEGEITVGSKNVVPGDQTCEEGESISGTDKDGDVICEIGGGTEQLCNVNNTSLDFPIRLLGRCQLGDLPLCSELNNPTCSGFDDCTFLDLSNILTPEPGVNCIEDTSECTGFDSCTFVDQSFFPVDGGWSEWSDSGNCGDINSGKQAQVRSCTNPSPQGSGNDCSLLDGGRDTQEVDCSDIVVYIDDDGIEVTKYLNPKRLGLLMERDNHELSVFTQEGGHSSCRVTRNFNNIPCKTFASAYSVNEGWWEHTAGCYGGTYPSYLMLEIECI